MFEQKNALFIRLLFRHVQGPALKHGRHRDMAHAVARLFRQTLVVANTDEIYVVWCYQTTTAVSTAPSATVGLLLSAARAATEYSNFEQGL